MGNHSIENFYVGELYFSFPSQSHAGLEEMRATVLHNNIVKNGGIDLKNRLSVTNAKTSNQGYIGVLTMFYHVNDNDYICLHDNKHYKTTGVYSCKNLVRLDHVIPTVGYYAPKNLSFWESSELFRQLFRPNGKLCYNYLRVPTDDLYFGNLNLYSGVQTDLLKKGISYYTYYNLLQEQLLFSNYLHGAKYIGGFSKEASKKGKKIRHDYETFRCVFLRLPSNQMYNINSNHIYKSGILEPTYYEKFYLGDSFYDQVVPFRSELEEKGITCKKEAISVPKILSLQRKIHLEKGNN